MSSAERRAGRGRIDERVAAQSAAVVRLATVYGASSRRFAAPAVVRPAELAERRHVAVRAAREQRPRRRLAAAGRSRARRRSRTCSSSDGVKRSCENGIRNSAVQPCSSRDTVTSHTASQLIVAVRVVEPVAILLHAGRVHGELVRRAAIVVRVDQHANPVARRLVVAPREVGDDLVRLGVERAHLHEERGRVVGDAELGRLRRLGALSRLALDEAPDRRHGLPHVFREAAPGACGRDANRPGAGRRPPAGAAHDRKRNECGNHHEHGTLDANRGENGCQATYS